MQKSDQEPFYYYVNGSDRTRERGRWSLLVTCVLSVCLLLFSMIAASVALGVISSGRNFYLNSVKALSSRKEASGISSSPPSKQLAEGYESVAKTLKESGNSSVDPCQDFWAFACGTLRSRYTIYSRQQAATEVWTQKVIQTIRQLDLDSVPSPLRNIYRYVLMISRKCKDSSMNKAFLKDVQALVFDVGGSPLLDPVAQPLNPFLTSMTLYALSGVPSLVSELSKKPMVNDPRAFGLEVALHLDLLTERSLQATLGYSLHHLNRRLDPDVILHYRHQVQKAKRDLSRFQRHLLTKKMKLQSTFSAVYPFNQTSFRDLAEASPLLAQALAYSSGEADFNSVPLFWAFAIKKTVGVPASLKDLREFSKLVARHWKLVQINMIEDFLALLFDGDGFLGYNSLICDNSLQSGLNDAILRLLIDNYNVTQEKILQVRDLFERLRAAFSKRILHLDWLDSHSKTRALNKLMDMVPRIIAPPFIFDDFQLAQKYQFLPEISDEEQISLLDLIRAVSTNRWRQQFQGLRHRLATKSETHYANQALSTTAAYHQIENTINVFLGYLQPPIFNWDFPTVYKFAVLGAVLGHEIIHGFDIYGSQFGTNGRFQPWLTPEASATLQRKTKCFSAQASQFCFEYDGKTHCLDGDLSLGESMADLDGLRMAYSAFKDLGPSAESYSMPGLEHLSQDQLFFLSYANLWCDIIPKKYQVLYLTNPHPLGHFRVIGTLQNLPEFADAFHCPSGSPMNPRKKCQAW